MPEIYCFKSPGVNVTIPNLYVSFCVPLINDLLVSIEVILVFLYDAACLLTRVKSL